MRAICQHVLKLVPNIERSKFEDLIVSADDWILAARNVDRLDAPKRAAVKKAMKDWGVIETSREVLRHRQEQEELRAEIFEEAPVPGLHGDVLP